MTETQPTKHNETHGLLGRTILSVTETQRNSRSKTPRVVPALEAQKYSPASSHTGRCKVKAIQPRTRLPFTDTCDNSDTSLAAPPSTEPSASANVANVCSPRALYWIRSRDRPLWLWRGSDSEEGKWQVMVTVDDVVGVGALEVLESVCVPGVGIVPVMLRRFARRDRRVSI